MKTYLPLIVPLMAAGLLVSATLALAQGPLTPPGAPAPTMVTLSQIEPRTPISALPATITTSGSYYLTSNMTCTACSGFANGITIVTNDVTLDLNGFTVQGVAGSGSGITVPNPERNLAIRNGVLDSWGESGVYAYNGYNSQFERLRVSNSGEDGLDAGSNCLVLVCSVIGNAFYGINVSNNGTVKDCTASGNAGVGIFLAGSGGNISQCVTVNNTGIGIQTSSGCVVVDCSASGNGRGGIRDGINVGVGTVVRSCASYQNTGNGVTGNNCTIKDCTVSTNGNSGIVVQSNGSIINCNASGNGNEGIDVNTNCIVKDCTVCGSVSYGIYIRGGQNLIDGNYLGNNGFGGILPAFGANVNNRIIRNSAVGNGGLNYYNYSGNNDYAPTGTPSTATSPWANF